MTTTGALPRALVAIVTPYTPDDHIDLDAHRHNVDRLSEQGCAGFVVAGSTGEGPYLSSSERGDLVSATREAQPDAYVMCGINAESVAQALHQISVAAQAGADSALVLTPTTLVRGNDSAVEWFYRTVADESAIQIFLYSNPKPTAYELPTTSVAALAEHPNIIGIKDSGGNPARLDDITDAIAAGFIVYPGASRALLASHAKGAYGAITASANYAYRLVAGASSGAAESQDALDTVIAVVEPHGIPGTKEAAEANGLRAGDPRPPLLPVDSDAATEIAVAVANAQRH